MSFAVFLVLVGAFWLAYPNFWDEVGRWFRDLRPYEVNSIPVFVEPIGNHAFLYNVVGQFFVVLSLWYFGLIAIRYYYRSNPRLISGTVARAIFLLGLGLFSWQLQAGAMSFPSVVPLIVFLAGAVLIAQGIWNMFMVKGSA